jgi:hypothetical protein
MLDPDAAQKYLKWISERVEDVPPNGASVILGPAGDKIRIGSGPALPGPGMDYWNGSLFENLGLWYVNTGSELAPVWIPLGTGIAADYDRAQMEVCGTQQLSPYNEANPLTLPFTVASYLDTPPFNFLGVGVIQVTEDDDYRLSYNLPFISATGGLAGVAVGAYWEKKVGGGSWTEIPETRSFDTVYGADPDSGAVNLPPYEVPLVAGTQLRIRVFEALSFIFPQNCEINGPSNANWAWARIERGSVGGFTIGAVTMLEAPGNPNTVISAYKGRLYRDSNTGVKYVNIDGATAWEVI